MPAGRPRAFDVDKALDSALELFWTHGYEGTSLAMLTEAMGINVPSLYAAFGNKETLFRKALERYLEGSGFRVQGSGAEGAVANRASLGTGHWALGAAAGTAPAAPTIYTCGPEPMMKRVADIAAARGLECQVAVERAMACGMGTCQSCCIRVRKPDPAQPPLPGKDWCYRLACTDGPVFRGAALLW